MRRDLLKLRKNYVLISGHPGVRNPGNPMSFAQRPLQISPTQNQDCLTKSFQRPSPGGKEVCSAKSKGATGIEKIVVFFQLKLRNRIQVK